MNHKCGCVILNYNDYETTEKLLEKIVDYETLSYIVIVDNCSTDNSYEYLKCYENDKVIVLQTDHNGGYGAGNNYGLRYLYDQLGVRYSLLANPDVIFTEKTVVALLETMDDDSTIGITAPIQLDINGEPIHDVAWRIPTLLQYSLMSTRIGKRFSDTTYTNDYINQNKKVVVECLPGAFLLIDLKKFFEIDGYDESIFLYCEETVLGIKMKKKGFKSVLLSSETYVHEHAVSINKTITSKRAQMEMIFHSRRNVMKKYLKANAIETFLCKLIQNHTLKSLH